MTDRSDPLALIGSSFADSSVAAFLAAHGGSHTLGEPDDPSGSRYVESDRSGVALSLDESGVIKTVFLYLNGHEQKPEFQGPLPLGLTNEMSQVDVRHRLGRPSFQRAATVVQGLGEYGPADRYDFPTYSVHLEFAAHSSRLLLVTIMAAAAVPGGADVRPRPHATEST